MADTVQGAKQAQSGTQAICSSLREVLAEWSSEEPASALLPELDKVSTHLQEWSTALPLPRLKEIVREMVHLALQTHPQLPLEKLRNLMESVGPDGYPSGDRMMYQILIPKPLQQAWTPQTLQNYLESCIGLQGILKAEVEAIWSRSLFSRWVCVAKGTQPVPGADAILTDEAGVYGKKGELEPFGEYADSPHLALNFCPVEAETVVIRKQRAQEGTPGTDVYGETVSGPMGINHEFLPYKNLVLSPDGSTLQAREPGFAFVERGVLETTDATVVNADTLTLEAPCEVPNSVGLKGTVTDGKQLKSGGMLFLHDDTAHADLSARRSIVSRGTIGRGAPCVLTAGGDVIARSLVATTVTAEGSVYIIGPVSDCSIQARRVWCRGESAVLKGGTIRAWDDVCADELGADPAVKTEIVLGSERTELQQENAATLSRIEERKVQISKVSAALSRLPKELIQLHQKAHQLRLSLLNLKKELNLLRKRQQKLVQMIQKGKDASRTVRARCRVYPGVSIRICGFTHIVEETLGPTCFTLVERDIVSMPFYEREWTDGFGEEY